MPHCDRSRGVETDSFDVANRSGHIEAFISASSLPSSRPSAADALVLEALLTGSIRY